MYTYLYGTVLPYTGDAETVVEYDDYYGMVTLVGGNVTYAGYQAALLADNYDLVGEDEEEGMFAVEKAVSTTEGTRFVYVYAEFDEEEGFYAEAYDPYYYSYPADAIAAFFEDYEATPFEIPEIDADYYSFQEDSLNGLYVLFGAADYVNASLYAFGCSEADYTAYMGVLETAGWEAEEKEYDGFSYFACTLSTSAGVASIEVSYYEEYEAVAITIYAYMGTPDITPDTTYTEWPASIVATMLGSDVTDTLPAYTGANKGFQILDDAYGTAVLVLVDNGSETAGVAAYETILLAAGYTQTGVDSYGDKIFASPNNQIEVNPYFGTTGSFTIAFKEIAQLQPWPASDVAAAVTAKFGSSITDVVPGIDGEDFYLYKESADKLQIQVTFTSGLDAALTQYAANVLAAGWTDAGKNTSGNTNYNSPNGQLYLCPWKYTSNGYSLLVIDVYAGTFTPAAAGWPTAALTEALGAEFANQIPVYDESRVYGFEEGSYADYIIYTNSDNATADAEAYRAILLAANYTEAGKDTYGDMHYTSPNGRVDLNPTDGYQGGIFVIEININPLTYTSWPTEAVAALAADNGVTNDVIPACDGGTKYEINENYTYSDAAIIVTCEDPTALNTAYCAVLAEAGWSYNGKVSGQETYTSPNGEITASMWVRSYSGCVNIELTFNTLD